MCKCEDLSSDPKHPHERPDVMNPGMRNPGVRKPSVRKPGVRKPGVRKPGVMCYSYNSSAGEAETGGSLNLTEPLIKLVRGPGSKQSGE